MPTGQFPLGAVNLNNPDGLSPDGLGYSKYNDGFDDMKKYAAEEGFNFPYPYDGDTQRSRRPSGASPRRKSFDADRKPRCKCQFDDSSSR